MYAIIQTGGKQYRVVQGECIDVELVGVEDGGQVEFNEVLFVHDGENTRLGQPSLKDFVVRGELVTTVAGPKVVAFKYKRRKDQQTKKGHRQKYSRVKITEIAATA